VASYKTSDFRKGLKVQIDGEPWVMVEFNFRKPGKGNALYECRLKNLIRGNTLSRVYKGGDSLEAADVEENDVQYLYKQPGGKGEDMFVFMDNTSFEQFEIDKDKLDEGWKYLKEGMPCTMMLFNGQPVSVTPPSHVELKVEYCEPGARGDTATNVTKSVRLETGAEILAPLFINMGNVLKIDTRTGEYVERVST
jgi:elongation factor P